MKTSGHRFTGLMVAILVYSVHESFAALHKRA